MSKTKKVITRIIKIIAIIALIFSILSTAFYFIFNSSITKANNSGTIPKIFGKEFITVSSDKFNDIVPKGSMVILQPIDVSNLTGTEVLVYETGNTTVDNSVYSKFSLGRTMKSSDGSQSENVSIQNVITEDIIEVPLTSIKSQAVYQISYIGSLINKVSTDLGLLQFVVMPISLFIILLLVLFIIKLLSSDDTNDEYVSDVQEEQTFDLKFNKENFNDNDESIYQDRLVRLKDRYYHNENADSNEKLNLNFEKKQPEVVSEIIHSSDLVNDHEETTDNSDNSNPIDVVDEKENISQDTSLETMTDNIISKIIDEDQEGNTDQAEAPKSSYDDASAQVDEFLRSLNIDLDSVEHEYMNHTTIEFDMDKINDKLLDQDLSKEDKSQSLLDNILIDLKDNALDFRFDSLKSDSIEIKESRKGDGFTIKTPNYKANIKVEIDKN